MPSHQILSSQPREGSIILVDFLKKNYKTNKFLKLEKKIKLKTVFLIIIKN